MKYSAVLFETIVDGEGVSHYEDALQQDYIRSQVSDEVRARKDPALDSGTGHLVVKGWEDGKYYPYPLLFWSRAGREKAAEHFMKRDGGDLPYIPSDDDVDERIQEIEDYILMMDQ